jgi:hypothetical protein
MEETIMELTDYQQEAYDKMMKGSFQGNWCRQAGATVTLAKAVIDAKDDVQWFAPKEMHENIANLIMDSAPTESVKFLTDKKQWWEGEKIKTSETHHSHVLTLLNHNKVRLESNHPWSMKRLSKILATDCPGHYNIEDCNTGRTIWAIGNGPQKRWHPDPQVIPWHKSVIIYKDEVERTKELIPEKAFEAEYGCKFKEEEE